MGGFLSTSAKHRTPQTTTTHEHRPQQQITLKGAQTAHIFLTVYSCNHARIRSGGTPCVDNKSGMRKAGFPGDDAPRAVPSDARHDGRYGPDGRKNLALHILQRRERGRALRALLRNDPDLNSGKFQHYRSKLPENAGG